MTMTIDPAPLFFRSGPPSLPTRPHVYTHSPPPPSRHPTHAAAARTPFQPYRGTQRTQCSAGGGGAGAAQGRKSGMCASFVVCVCVCVFVCVCLCFFQVYLASGLLSWLWVFMSLTFFFNFFFPNFVSFVGLIDGSIVYISYIGRQKDGYIDIEICINHPPPHTPPPQR